MVAKVRKEISFFKKITAIPYLLVFLALLMPMVNVSCSTNKEDVKTIAEPTLYQFASGVNLEESLKEPALGHLHHMIEGNPRAMEKFKMRVPNFPKMEPITHLYGILVAIFLAAVFSWFTPLGAIAMGVLSMFSLWSLSSKLAQLSAALGIPLLKVEPGIGLYCASFLLIIGTAMNLSTMVRKIKDSLRQKQDAVDADRKQ